MDNTKIYCKLLSTTHRYSKLGILTIFIFSILTISCNDGFEACMDGDMQACAKSCDHDTYKSCDRLCEMRGNMKACVKACDNDYIGSGCDIACENGYMEACIKSCQVTIHYGSGDGTSCWKVCNYNNSPRACAVSCNELGK